MELIFRLLFKRKINEIKTGKDELYSVIRRLKKENESLISNLKNEELKNERIQFLINNNMLGVNELQIEKTDKGVLTLVKIKHNPIEILIYNVDVDNVYEKHTLLVYTSSFGESLRIKDIQGGNSFGHGSLAMKHLFKLAKEKGFKSITGDLSYTDFEHKDRLFHFYEKHGFEIKLFDNRNYFGSIKKELKT